MPMIRPVIEAFQSGFKLASKQISRLSPSTATPMFPLSECVSVSILTPDQAETDRLWEALAADGGSHGPCGWLKDRYGLSWQVVPKLVYDLMTAPDRDRAGRALAAVMQMGKIDIAAVDAAAKAA